MRALLVTYGSYGDLHPFLGLTRALRKLGHEVTLASHAEYEEQVRREGARFVAIPPSFADIGPDEEWTARAHHRIHGPEYIIREIILPYVEASYRILHEVAPGHDLILSHSLTYAAGIIGDKFRIPRLGVALQPSVLFSAYDPPVIAAAPSLRWVAKFGPRFYDWVFRILTKRTHAWMEPVQQLRVQEGVGRSAQSPLFRGQFSEQGNLFLFPASFAARQPDWPSGVTIGFPFFDEETSAELNPATARFLEAGPPPVVFTLGSTVVMGKTSFFDIALDAMDRVGGRAIFLYGRNPGGIPTAARQRPRIHLSDYEPFSKLFPRAESVVHQCGIGTTAQALRAGRPEILVPFSHDQPDNALRVRRMGVGKVISSDQLNTDRLARAITELRSDARVAENARRTSQTFQPIDFTEALRDALHQLLGW